MRGRGLEHLRRHDIEVVTGVLADEAERLNAGYVHHRSTGLPLLSLKLASSLDGRLGAPDGSSQWITGEVARRSVHARRAEVDAIIVGAGTILADDARLTARHPDAARQPARVVVDAAGRVPPEAAVFSRDARVVVASTARAPHEAHTAWKEAGAEVLVLSDAPSGVDLGELMRRLGDAGMLEVMCEGGAALATSLLREGLVDRLELHLGPVLLGEGGPCLGDLGVAGMGDALRFRLERVERAGDDVVVVLERERNGAS
jgi:diaminohydroxyphosphoribosylaminopyrimidine deaminase/5-amino-6-(5-phosphoribosylamino)uracil reductase